MFTLDNISGICVFFEPCDTVSYYGIIYQLAVLTSVPDDSKLST